MFVSHGVSLDPFYSPLVLERDPEYHLAPECPSSKPSLRLPSIEALANRIAPLVLADPTSVDGEFGEIFPSTTSKVVPRVVPPDVAAADFVFPTLRETYGVQQRERWVENNLSDRIRVKLNDPHGKESLHQWFHAEATLRHCVLPMLR